MPKRKKKKTRHIVLPSKRKIFRRTEPWKAEQYIYRKPYPLQEVVPKDRELLKKIGIKKDSKVLFFAGGAGDWAKALSEKGCQVTYTDVSPSMVQIAKKKFGNKGIKRFRKRDALLHPRRKKVYDWSVSFEPVPLWRKSLPITLVRSLLNNKGAKIISTPGYGFYKIMKSISRIYKVDLESKTRRRIWTKKALSGLRNPQIEVFTLRTNEQARKKTELDLKVLNAVDKTKKINPVSVGKKLNVRKKTVIKSLERLSRIAKLIEKEIRSRKEIQQS